PTANRPPALWAPGAWAIIESSSQPLDMLRLRSLKTRTALALSSVIVAILVFNGVYMILTKRGELRKGIEEDARTFAHLTRTPIASAFLSFYSTDFYRFRELLRGLLALNRDVTRVRIA